MRRPAFTLLELQAALFLGVVVASLAGLLLFYEWERQVRVAAEERLQAAVQRADATLQWLLTAAESGEITENRLVCVRDGETWIFDAEGIHHGTSALFAAAVQPVFSDFTVSGSDLRCRLRAQYGGRDRDLILVYRLPPWWSP
ncbi:hypothetical protein [Acanthopleuribacter pedis]|uniref:Uncharacterized protein n=1 Tax=Acanthopleuribacter pedis TaxID=442870 RepID=A0A8J7QAI2_9BACT|nr:hypothetical protein [Acanthopleuribacter pedis]MBO1321841.1 hypothetical protein [Acanthopleuribacter pedis]